MRNSTNFRFRYTCFGLAHRLADTVQFACRVAVEQPDSFVKRTAFRSAVEMFCLHRVGVGIQCCLSTAALIDCCYYGVHTTPSGVMLQLILKSCDAYKSKDTRKIIQVSACRETELVHVNNRTPKILLISPI